MTKEEMVQFALKSDDTVENTMWKIYQQGRADCLKEAHRFADQESYKEGFKRGIDKGRADMIGEVATRLEEELTMVMPRDKVRYVMYKVHTVLEQLKENNNG